MPKLLLIPVLLAATVAHAQPRPVDPVALVNGEPITRAEYEAVIARLRDPHEIEPDEPSLRRRALSAVLYERVIAQHARRWGITIDSATLDAVVDEISARTNGRLDDVGGEALVRAN